MGSGELERRGSLLRNGSFLRRVIVLSLCLSFVGGFSDSRFFSCLVILSGGGGMGLMS